MNIDFAIAIAVIALSALILYFKSHAKFVAMGVFIGLTLIEIIPLDTYFASPRVASVASIVLLTIPALILGINHTVDKRKGSMVKTIIVVLVFTLFFLSSLLQVAPPAWQTDIINRSIIGWNLLNWYEYFTLAAAVLILLDSIEHRHKAEKDKKKKVKK